MATTTLFDFEQVRDTFRIFSPHRVTEIRLIDASMTFDRYEAKIWSGYFDNIDAICEALREVASFSGCYFVLNECDPSLLARSKNRLKKQKTNGLTTADSQILRRRWLPIDCDPCRPTGISSSDAEHDAALGRAGEIIEFFRELGWPEPIMADSGNGAHVLYPIDLPTDDNGLVPNCLKAVAERFPDDGVKIDTVVGNPSRIWKLYGSLACKGDSVPDRPHRMARLLSVPEHSNIVSVTHLETLAATIPSSTTPTLKPSTSSRSNPFDGESFDVESFIQRHNLQVNEPTPWQNKLGTGRLWTFSQSPMCDHHGDGPFIGQLGTGAVTAGCHHNSCNWIWKDLRERFEPRTERTSSNAVSACESPATLTATPAQTQKQVSPPEPWQPFPVGALPEPLKSFVKAGAKAIGCDETLIILPMLGVLSPAVGNTRTLMIKPGWFVPSILWCAIVGESGSSKTPAFSLVVRAVRRLERLSQAKHEKTMKEYETDLAHFERDYSAWKKSKSGEPPEKPKEPTAKRYVTSNATMEALGAILKNNPRGVLLACDELAAWLGSFDKYSAGKANSDEANWLSLYNADTVVIDRKTGHPKTLYIHHGAVPVIGGIQPGVLHRTLGEHHRESGLAARLLLAYPPRRAKVWSEACIDEATEKAFGDVIERLYDLEPDIDADGNPRPMVLRLSAEAKRAYIDYYNQHGAELSSLSGELAAAWSKLEELPGRLSIVFHMTRVVTTPSSDANALLVDGDTMRRAITMTEWFKYETRRVYAVLRESADAKDRRTLIEWIQARGGETTERELQRGPRQYRDAADAELALTDLVAMGAGIWVSIPATQSGGRPTRIFRLATPATVTEPKKTRENGGFVAVATPKDSESQDETEGLPCVRI